MVVEKMASIRDIAKMAGVSAASVSRILNNDETFSINENTRKRVIDIANKMNYSKEKNRHGSRSTGDEQTIALVVRHSAESELDDPYFRYIRRGIEKEAEKWRLRVLRVFRMRDKEKDWEQLSKYGAVVMVGEMTQDAVEKAYSFNQKLILVDTYTNYSQYDCIQTDFADKTHEILDTLYQNGHRRFAFIGGLASKVAIDGQVVRYKEEVRAENFQEWIKLNNLEDCAAVYQGSWSTESGVALAKEMLAADSLPTAVVVASDPMAVGVYRAINDAGLRIPADISIVSFDDIDIAQYMTPALSSVRMNAEEMGCLAVRLAKERMLEERIMPIRVICSTELKLRESVKKISEAVD
jgi:LacI family transcriptional regulator